jgi:hypothetical protein
MAFHIAWIIATPGNVIDYRVIEAHILLEALRDGLFQLLTGRVRYSSR